MWEFPLAIMDGYLPQQYEKARERTLEILDECREKGLEYITILFHDFHFCEDYQDLFKWYQWLAGYFSASEEYEFTSYGEAIRELDKGRKEEA